VVTESDETIMNKVKEGHLDDLSELFERYHVRIYNFILKLTYDRIVSQDLTQNLFYRIIKYRHTFNDAHTFKSWIYQLARNIHSDYCKNRQKMTDQYISVESYDENTVDTGNEFGEEEFQRLEKAMSRLKPEQKEILILSRFQGLKYSEISAIQNSSVSSIKVQVHRTIKDLRNFYFKTT
jgi:RNA polymerase sigma factor (sigma-70 family)